MAGMFDDLIPQQAPSPTVSAAPPAAPATPQAGMFDDLIPAGVRFAPDGAPTDVVNKPTAPNDPIYHGAVPVGNAPDMGAATAFGSGVQGVPVVGPAIESGLQKVAAGARSLADGTKYADELRNTQEMTELARYQHPGVAFAGDLTGATAALAPVIEAAPGVFGAGGGGLTAGQIGAGSASGLALGGADAAVRSGGDPTAIAAGALGGMAGGAAAPALGAVASRVVGAGADAIARAAALRNVGISQPAAEIITRAAQSDGALGGQGAANIAAAGPNGMLADAGPGLSTVLDTAMQRGGAGAVAARQAIEGRAAGADQDLTAALDTSLGRPQGVQTATNDIRTSSAPARQDAYDAAYAAPIDYSSPQGRAIETLVRNHVPPSAIDQANALIRADPSAGPSRQIIAHLADDGSVNYERMPDVRQLDYITRGLNDVADAQNGQGKLGGTTLLGNTYTNLSRALRGQLRQAVPEYGTALDTAAQPIQARNALDFGSNLLRSNVPQDVAADTIGNMTPPEIAQARQGVRSSIAETLANVQRTITDPNVDARQAMTLIKQLSSDAAQQKLGLLVGQPEQRAMTDALTRATSALQLRGAVAMNSRTFARTATNDAVKEAAAPSALDRLLQGEPLKAGKAAVQFVTARRPSDITARENAIYGELANTLTGPRGPAAVSMLDRLTQAHNTRAAVGSFARQIPYAGFAQNGVLSSIAALNQRAQ